MNEKIRNTLLRAFKRMRSADRRRVKRWMNVAARCSRQSRKAGELFDGKLCGRSRKWLPSQIRKAQEIVRRTGK